MLIAPAGGRPDPVLLTPMTDELASLQLGMSGSGASATYPTAALAYFYAVRLTRPRTYVKAFWLNGAAVAGNVDVGIYTISGATATRVVASTAEAQAGTTALQVAATFTTTTIGPGLYYLAISATLATATFMRSGGGSATMTRGHVFQAATSSPLPSSATVVQAATNFIPVFGFAERSTI